MHRKTGIRRSIHNPESELKLVLASASPRRRELLASLGLAFEVVPSRYDESSLSSDGLTPEAYALALASEKAREVRERLGIEGSVILAADTIVVAPEGEILNKPADAEDALRMLRLLSGRVHRVITAVCALAPGEPMRLRSETTGVAFRDLSEVEMRGYAESGEPLDKAGGYGIQEGAAKFVRFIQGDYSNVVGLPLEAVRALLSESGIQV